MNLLKIKDFDKPLGPNKKMSLIFRQLGATWEPWEVIEYIIPRSPFICEIKLIGEEPVNQGEDLLEFLSELRKDKDLKRLNIILYTGYAISDIPANIRLKLDTIVSNNTIYDKYTGKYFLRRIE